ncbi:PRD domain-containing protein [Enterococcus mundtii]|uniref:PRD domain-containing protein n=1 Tax=Enterococcus mundtii TaxID=53346 RepID=UPI002DBD6D41|nr:PRD domain-containing protein [Enterococcus mundtii]MEC3942306.1 PRD domain-containing protein [Enterococcus mundtii]
MKIKKILNNNAILVGEKGKDYIWIGTGLGFKMKPGLEADESKIEKIFIMRENFPYQRLERVVTSIPIEYFLLADEIIQLAEEKLKCNLSETLYVSLTDHLFHTIKLYRQGFAVPNRLFWEIKKSYPKEFAVGEYALKLVEENTKVTLGIEEAGNIAMHLINAQISENNEHFMDAGELIKKVHDITTIIRLSNKVTINEESLAYDRFVTHLRFFFQRFNNAKVKSKKNLLLVNVKEQYYQAFQTMKIVEEYLGTTLNDDEQLYLTLHIQKLIEND